MKLPFYIILMFPLVLTAQSDQKGNPVFNSVEIKDDTLQDYLLVNSYYTIKNNIDNPLSSVYISAKPTQEQILNAATRLPSDVFLVKKNKNALCMILANTYPAKYFLVLNIKNGEKKTFEWSTEGDISEHRATELIEEKYDADASIENSYLKFNNKKLGIISNQETKQAVIQLIKKEHLDLGDTSNIQILSQSDLKKYILAETKPGGKLDYFTPITGKEFDIVQIKPGVIAPMIEVALYKWGTACFELGLNTVDDAYTIFVEYKGRNLNIRETTTIKDGFDKKNY